MFDCTLSSRKHALKSYMKTWQICSPHPGARVKSASVSLGQHQLVVRYHTVGSRPFVPEDGFNHLVIAYFLNIYYWQEQCQEFKYL